MFAKQCLLRTTLLFSAAEILICYKSSSKLQTKSHWFDCSYIHVPKFPSCFCCMTLFSHGCDGFAHSIMFLVKLCSGFKQKNGVTHWTPIQWSSPWQPEVTADSLNKFFSEIGGTPTNIDIDEICKSLSHSSLTVTPQQVKRCHCAISSTTAYLKVYILIYGNLLK